MSTDSYTLYFGLCKTFFGFGAVKTAETFFFAHEKKPIFVFCDGGFLCYNHHWRIIPC